ncbi:MAG: hypothetical protein V7640_2951 [Betaproteobacteria bacterium]
MSQRTAGKRLARRRSRCDCVPGKRGYRYIDATYRSLFTEPSPNNGSAVDTEGDGVQTAYRFVLAVAYPGFHPHVLEYRFAQGEDR